MQNVAPALMPKPEQCLSMPRVAASVEIGPATGHAAMPDPCTTKQHAWSGWGSGVDGPRQAPFALIVAVPASEDQNLR